MKFKKILILMGILSVAVSAEEAPQKVEKVIPVVTQTVEEKVFEEKLSLQGTVQAVDVAMVPARKDGTLMKLFVDEGDVVVAGKTKLLLTDNIKLKKNLELRKLDLEVSKSSLQVMIASSERSKAALERAEKYYKRQKHLLEVDKIGTVDRVEEAESQYKQALADVKYTLSQVELAKAQVDQAAASVDMAQKDFDDTIVYAPINGVVSERLHDVGEMGGSDKPVFKIESIDKLEVSVYLPSFYYSKIKVGKTMVAVAADGTTLGKFPVSYRSPVIDPKLRVFEVKCKINDKEGILAPGYMVNVEVVLSSVKAIGVPRKSIVNRGGKSVVFIAENGKAKAVPVQTGVKNNGWLSVIKSNLTTGMKVVEQGQFLLNDGMGIDIRNLNEGE